MTAWRTLGVLAGVLALAPTATWGQTYHLAETPKAGECVQYKIDTDVSGVLKVPQDGKVLPIKLAVTAKHEYVQRHLAVKDALVSRAARYYTKCESAVSVGGDATAHQLRDDRKLVVAQRGDGVVCYSPGGPLTRDELDLLSQHFETLALVGLLPPDKKVDPDAKWTVPNPIVQALCFFDGLISHDIQASVTEVKDGLAVIKVAGKADGIELGAKVSLTVDATLRYELLRDRIASVEWTRKDKRDAGPANPPSEIETTTKLTRTMLDAQPKELGDVALVSVPAGNEIPMPLDQLSLNDTKGRYSLLHGREWHVVSQTDTHLVTRLIDRGDFVAQAAVAVWRKAEPGKHITPEEMGQLVARQPNWEMEEEVDRGEVPTDGGKWLYRITAKGTMGGLKVVQTFYCLASPEGEQLIVTFTMKPANSSKIGTRDVALVNAIEFGKK